MPNGVRHGIGVVIGLILTPVLFAGLVFGIHRTTDTVRYLKPDAIGIGVVLIVAVLLGVLVGSRISPLASLIPGMAYTAVGLLWAVDPFFAARYTKFELPGRFDSTYYELSGRGVLLLLGVLLLVTSLFPSRWAARRPQPDAVSSHEYSPLNPPYGQAPPLGQPGPAPYPPAPAAPVHYSPQPAPEQRPAARKDNDGDAGDWTQRYGSDQSDKNY